MVAENAEGRLWSRPVHPWVAGGVGEVRFGPVVHPAPDAGRLREQAQLIESLGYDAMWTYDHPTYLGAGDCWITLALLATATSTIRLGSAISCIAYRSPVLLARMAADIDQLSGGRLVLGVGVGDNADEFAQLGLPFPKLRDRQAALGEALDIVDGLWAGGDPFTYRGSHYQISGSKLLSLPVQQPRIPILIAGGGERVTLRQVADRADMANFGAHPWTGGARTRADVLRKYDVLRAHCEAAGREYDSVSRSWFEGLFLADSAREAAARLKRFGLAEDAREPVSPADAVSRYRDLADAGVQHFIVYVLPGDVETIRRLAQEVIPAVRRR